jgi:hypothetical protein
MGAVEIEEQLRDKLRAWAIAEDKLDGAIYQDMGINGMDFYELLCEIDDEFTLPEFDWSEFSDINEPPDGLALWSIFTLRGPKILPRKRLTIEHLSSVIADGKWFEP